jgi:hypothetical protein
LYGTKPNKQINILAKYSQAYPKILSIKVQPLLLKRKVRAAGPIAQEEAHRKPAAGQHSSLTSSSLRLFANSSLPPWRLSK